MTDNSITGALRRLGYIGDEIIVYGFRSMGSKLFKESHLFHPMQ
jgi:hypothetical protein